MINKKKLDSIALVGKWSFLIGILIAIAAAFIGVYESAIMFVLFVLGLIVGLLNVVEKDVVKFLVGAMALLILGAGSLGAISLLGVYGGIVQEYLNLILGNFVSFVGAAVFVVSIKAILETSK